MRKKYIGIICIIISAFFFALMNLFVRLSGPLPVFQKSFFRNLVALFFAAIILMKDKPKMSLDKENLLTLLLRSTFGTIGILCNYYAVDHLLLADASMLGKLSPFFALIMGAVILQEKLPAFQVGMVLTALFGAVLVIKPGNGLVAFPALVGLVGGFAAGTAYTFVRAAGQRGIPGAFIVFFFSAFSCLSVLPIVIMGYTPMNLHQLIYLLLAGTSAAIAQFAITAAYCNAPARDISVFDYSQIIFAAILGFIVFQQIPDMLSWVGYSVILFTAGANFIYSRKEDKRNDKAIKPNTQNS